MKAYLKDSKTGQFKTTRRRYIKKKKKKQKNERFRSNLPVFW